MEKVKVVVNKMPECDAECPFAINSKSNQFPCVCDLKHDKSMDIRFGHGNYDNCNLSKGKPCNMLITVKQILEEKENV